MSVFVQFFIGLLFGTGLVVAGMSDPAKVLNFLDVASIATGAWDPSLALVMAAGVVVTFIGYRVLRQQKQPIFSSRFEWPTRNDIDKPLLTGAAIFGMGWGLGGFCPGPAFTAVGTGNAQAIAFALAMLAGMIAARFVSLKQTTPAQS